jgi:hypothetical protein
MRSRRGTGGGAGAGRGTSRDQLRGAASDFLVAAMEIGNEERSDVLAVPNFG